jgi:hypothetical protein
MQRILLTAASLVVLSHASACTRAASNPPGVRGDAATSSADAAIPRSDAGPRPDGAAADDCANGAARWIYVVDSDNTFLRFEPDSERLTSLGALDCPAGSATPFSMAVDRNAHAWVLYSDGRIFDVDIEDSLRCTATSFQPLQRGFEVFGMGFVKDPGSSGTESLYVTGGALDEVGEGRSRLGAIDPVTLELQPIAMIDGWPELTGNGGGELWGFFPDTDPPSVRQLDRSTGQVLRDFDVEEINPLGTVGYAWAFAFWGGRYYVFFRGAGDDSTHIWRLTPDTRELVDLVPDTGRRIVGAGVSTCAPLILL